MFATASPYKTVLRTYSYIHALGIRAKALPFPLVEFDTWQREAP